VHRSGVRSHVHSTLKLSLCFASQFLYTVYTCSPDRRCVGSVAVTPHHPSTTPPRTYTVGVNTHNDQNCVDTVPSLGPHPYPMAHHISPRTLRSHRRHPVPIHMRHPNPAVARNCQIIEQRSHFLPAVGFLGAGPFPVFPTDGGFGDLTSRDVTPSRRPRFNSL